MISTIWGYVLTDMSAYVAAGVALYVLDRTLGMRIYPYWYNLTRWKPRPYDGSRGFIYNRSTKYLLWFTGVISFMETIYGLFDYNANPMIQILTTIFDVPMMLIGFGLGRLVYRMLLSRDKIIGKIDEFREGAESVKLADVAEKAKGAGGGVVDTIRSFGHSIWRLIWPIDSVTTPPPSTPQPEAKAAPETPAPKAQELSGAERIEQFTKRRR